MPIGLNDFVKKLHTPQFLGSASKIFGNIWSASAIITVMVLLLIMILYPGQPGTPVWVFGKLGLYIFLMTCGALLIHSAVLRNKYSEKNKDAAHDRFSNVLDGTGNMTFADEAIPVTASFGGSHEITPDIEPQDSSDISAGDLFTLYGV